MNPPDRDRRVRPQIGTPLTVRDASGGLDRALVHLRRKDKRQLSGFRLLPAGDQAFDARIALARRAEKTLDVQYYLIAHDTSGMQFLRELRNAAARGVRVRILVDDLYAIGQDELLAALAAHANVEVRMFNPLPVRNGGLASRVVLSMHQFSRINGRMHNKLFIADNAFSVSGGRNIADEYFGRSEPANFIDMDILSTGPVVRELSNVFDRYWNRNGCPRISSASTLPPATVANASFGTLRQHPCRTPDRSRHPTPSKSASNEAYSVLVH